MKSLCLFASYFSSQTMPYYVKVYVEELKKHFSDVILIGQNELLQQDKDFLANLGVQYRKEKNEGYDFGMWYKALQALPDKTYDSIALVNDSSVLFKPLAPFVDWMNGQKAELLGMSRSEAVSPHIQSYFLVLKGKAIEPGLLYFKQQGILQNLQQVIDTYEIGLSDYLTKQGIEMASFVDNKRYVGEFSPYYHLLDYHLQQGIPLIKKKVVFSSYRMDELLTLARMNFKIASGKYLEKILMAPDGLLKREDLLKDVSGSLSTFQVWRYEVWRLGIGMYKNVKQLFKSKK